MSRRLERDPDSGEIIISFPYDEELLPVVRALPERRWHPGPRHWSVPGAHAPLAVARLLPYGFRVSSDLEALAGELAREGSEVGGPDLEWADGAGLDHITVTELNERVRGALRRAFPGSQWVVGEVVGYDRNAHKRHVYFQLADKEEGDDRPRAVVSAVLFERTKQRVLQQLATAPDALELRDGIRLRLRARVDLYPPSGSYQLIVEEVDPEFTLGEIARRRERILAEIDRLGLRERNLARPFPRPSLRIALVTSFGSDAYNDLLHELEASGYAFDIALYDSHVQGARAEEEVLAGLAHFAARAAEYDVLAVVRGGGARTDLMAFDSLALARAVAEHPLKVLIGIGHHRDRCVLDFIAHSEKTPTAVGQRIVALADAERRELAGWAALCQRLAAEGLNASREGITLAARTLSLTVENRLVRSRSHLTRCAAALGAVARIGLTRERERLRAGGEHLSRTAVRRLADRRRDHLRAGQGLITAVIASFARERARLEGRGNVARGAHPLRLLARGYAWLRSAAGISVKSVQQVTEGERLTARLADGELTVGVEERHPRP